MSLIKAFCYDSTSGIFMASSCNRVHSFVSMYGCLGGPVGQLRHQERTSVSITPSLPSHPSFSHPSLIPPSHFLEVLLCKWKKNIPYTVYLLISSMRDERSVGSTTCSEMHQCREEESKRRKGGINRLNDKKEQCCDSEQLVFPSVDRPRFFWCVCVWVCTRVRARLIETDCPVIVHFRAGLCS